MLRLTAEDRWLLGAPSRGFGPRRAAYGEVFVEAPGCGGSAPLTGDGAQGMGRWVDVETERTTMSWLVRGDGMLLVVEDKGEIQVRFVVKKQTRAIESQSAQEPGVCCCYNRICYRQRSTTNTLRSSIRSGGLLA